MSMSAEAKLFWGVVLARDGEPIANPFGQGTDGYEHEWEDFVDAHEGLKRPPNPENWNDHHTYDRAAWVSYWDATHEAVKRHGIEIVSLGYHEEPTDAIAADGSVQCAVWAYRLVEPNLRMSPYWYLKVKSALHLLGLEDLPEPKWIMGAYYG